MVQGVLVENGYLVGTNPATGEITARVKMTTPEEIKQVVENAKAAQPGWAATPLSKRVALIAKALQVLKTRKSEVAKLITMEMGKVSNEANDEVGDACEKTKFLSLVEAANKPELIHNPNGSESVIVRDPLGVVAVISPWNFPCDEILLLALPALAAGNSVIVKPSEVVPLTGEAVVKCLIETLPKNVVQLVQGDGSVGGALVESDINMVAMTGSSATGKRIMSNASSKLKRLVLELGGKDPMVVFKDCDLDKTAKDAVFFSMFNCGQVCCSVERIYVDNAIKEKFENKCKDYAEKMFASGELSIGPMVSRMQRDIVTQHVDDAIKRGAKVLFRQKLDPNLKGTFYPGTVLTDITQDMRIAIEETFGPIVCIIGFDGSEEEAVRLSNDTEYGLSASVYSQDIDKAVRVSAQIRAGQVGVNNWPLANAPKECPWVGQKGSGFGFHSGLDGWRQFSVPKSIIATAPIKQYARL